jgi:hypothetical protein
LEHTCTVHKFTPCCAHAASWEEIYKPQQAEKKIKQHVHANLVAKKQNGLHVITNGKFVITWIVMRA